MTPVSKHRRNGNTRARKSFPSGTTDNPKVATKGVNRFQRSTVLMSDWRKILKSHMNNLQRSILKSDLTKGQENMKEADSGA